MMKTVIIMFLTLVAGGLGAALVWKISTPIERWVNEFRAQIRFERTGNAREYVKTHRRLAR
jgi:hypothetical protein